jgi:hypothetical protein
MGAFDIQRMKWALAAILTLVTIVPVATSVE